MSSFLAFEAPSIYEVDLDFFVRKGIKALLIDRDNTLDSYDSLFPRKEAFLLKEELQKRGIRMLVFSNNQGKKLEGYLKELGVPSLTSSQKDAEVSSGTGSEERRSDDRRRSAIDRL